MATAELHINKPFTRERSMVNILTSKGVIVYLYMGSSLAALSPLLCVSMSECYRRRKFIEVKHIMYRAVMVTLNVTLCCSQVIKAQVHRHPGTEIKEHSY